MTEDGTSARDPEAQLARARLLSRLLGDDVEERTMIGRFALLAKLGTGGMGVVFTAHDAELDRKIAVKLLRADVTSDALRRRIVREAQAMAKLSHPNVAQVYEVGEHEGTTFIAMELVEGMTLREWQRGKPWRAVLDAYLQAGRGLAAAHAARLVHRDFKPDNVIVGDDGRVRVLDFGLARMGDLETTSEQSVLTELSVPFDDAMATPLTRDGEVMGTPAYMAPEQFRSEEVGPYTDQFSWCVAAWEGLFGQRPFAGETRAALLTNLLDGRITPSPRNAVPAAIRGPLLRGLSVAPKLRFAGMSELLAAVQSAAGVGRRRAIALGIVGATAGVIAVTLAATAKTPPCDGVALALADTWNDDARRRVRNAMLAPERAFVTAALSRVETGIDDYAEAWIDARRDACTATQIRGEQSAASMDSRMACLDVREHALAAVVSAIASGDADTFARADRLVDGLPAIDLCADRAYVESRTPVPTDEAQRALASDVERRLALVRVLSEAGELTEAKTNVDELVPLVAQLDHPTVVAEAGLAIARYYESAGDFETSERELTSAYFTAYRAADDVRSMQAAIEMFRIVGDVRRAFDEALTWEQHAEAAIARAGTDREHATFARYRALVRTRDGRVDEAITAANEAIERAVQMNGEDSLAHGFALDALGNAYMMQGRHDDAIATFERELAVVSRRLGTEHPLVANTANNLGGALAEAGRIADAKAHFQRALEVRERAYGPDHTVVAQSLANLGTFEYQQGEYAHALELLRRALVIQEHTRGIDDPNVALTLSVMGEVLAELGQHDEAERVFVRAIEIQERRLPKDHPEKIGPLLSLANLRLVQHREADALPTARQALDAFELRFGKEHPTVAYPLVALARIETALGHAAEARTAAERAVALRNVDGVRPVDRAQAMSTLAAALWLVPHERAQARTVVQRAIALVDGDSTPVAVDARAELEAWLVAHPEP